MLRCDTHPKFTFPVAMKRLTRFSSFESITKYVPWSLLNTIMSPLASETNIRPSKCLENENRFSDRGKKDTKKILVEKNVEDYLDHYPQDRYL